MVSQQINLRLDNNFLEILKNFSKEKGFSNVQESIKEILREKFYEEDYLLNEEKLIVDKIFSKSKKIGFKTENELFEKLG
jgi:metal-responsive CopG/Arc/MetJ family transcriptional regulator